MARVYVEKPKKVHADQYLGVPLPYVCTDAAPVGICQSAPIFPDWRPHVHGDGRVYELHETDWITTSFAFPARPPEVLTNTEFSELYGEQLVE